MANNSSNRMKKRINFILSFFIIIGFGGLICRLYYLQVVKGEEYQRLAVEQQMRSDNIEAERGTIYDRNMKVLAKSSTAWIAVISPNDIKTEEERILIADNLSEILGVDRETIIARSNRKGSFYEMIKSKLEEDEAKAVTQFISENNLNSVYLKTDTKRYYPYGTLASTVLGFTGSENHGAYGLEAYYDKVLSGTDGIVVKAKNSLGTDMSYRYQQILYDAEDGNSLVLTIDEVIQHYVEKNLELAVTEHNVQNRAVCIVVEIKTGRILAMASKGDFDPNEPLVIQNPMKANAIAELKAKWELDGLETSQAAYYQALSEAQFEQWSNKAVTEPYEPGSVFKLITAAGALESGIVEPNIEHFYCPGYHMVAGNRIACWKSGGHGSITFGEAVKFSCNPTFIMIGQRLGGERFYNYRELFGFHDVTGIDLPGEAEGNMHSLAVLSDKNMASLSSESFGQTFKVTPIQMAMAASAAVGGGDLMQPYIVEKIIDSEGNVVKYYEPVVKRQAISAETSQLLARLAEAVVGDSDGSGRKSYIPGYRVGGKTGTSQKIDAERDEFGQTKHILSFFGFAPADDPQIAVLVALDEPVDGGAYGSTIAAPVVGSILSDILPYLEIEPSYNEKELQQTDINTPYLIGQVAHDAQSALTALGLKSRIVGEGGVIVKQVPGAYEPIPRGGTVILYTENAAEEPTTVVVPNVVGLSGMEANRIIVNSGLNIKISGEDIENASSLAVEQNPPAGTEVDIGTVVTITFTNKDVAG